MLRRKLLQALSWRSRPICVFCATRTQIQSTQFRSFSASDALLKRSKRPVAAKSKRIEGEETLQDDKDGESGENERVEGEKSSVVKKKGMPKAESVTKASKKAAASAPKRGAKKEKASKTLKEAMRGGQGLDDVIKKNRDKQLEIQILNTEDLKFEAVEVEKPPVPRLSYGLDRVLFNPGVYRLQDPRSHIYNFDPYLENIMPVNEFDFDALSEYKTSSKDQALLDLTNKLGTKFTGSTSSMSSILQHFHYLLSNFRNLNHDMLSRGFPEPSHRFSKITLGPSAVFLRYKNGVYAIDADKTYDSPNIMSWLGHSLEKLLTSDRSEFELYRRSNPEKAPAEDNASRCYHYSRQGNVLMRSQLDAQDPRLPGTGVFDLKTRAVVSIRMNHKEYESGIGYQLRYAQGEWESYEREFYDMTRATLLKYSLQVRMGRMDGIFLAYHNIERIFGFQYLSLADMDRVLHGQEDTSLGDQEFKLSIALVDELLSRAIKQFPETSIRLHFETRDAKTPFMYIFAEPVTEERADEIQSAGEAGHRDFARRVVGIGKDDPEAQEAWQDVQNDVDEQVDADSKVKVADEEVDNTVDSATAKAEEVASNVADKPKLPKDKPTTEENEKGPLIGWTLTSRNKVNDSYIGRPVEFTKDDDWSVEYHLQEIPKGTKWRLHDALALRRKSLISMDDQEVDVSLKKYRELIQRISKRGRKWRDEQDKIKEEMGIRVYKPLGPGSEEAVLGEILNAPKREDNKQDESKKDQKDEESSTTEEAGATPTKKKSWFGL